VGVDVMTPGFTLPYAARITVPVFLAFGDQDTCTRPHIQPSAYSRCPDLTLTTYTDMKHLHNFAASRESLWERSVSWLDYLKSGRTGKCR
jgi:alpha-beta hydrolase superfamily lysophospholipase